jgi:hypothetical protein
MIAAHVSHWKSLTLCEDNSPTIKKPMIMKEVLQFLIIRVPHVDLDAGLEVEVDGRSLGSDVNRGCPLATTPRTPSICEGSGA